MKTPVLHSAAAASVILLIGFFYNTPGLAGGCSTPSFAAVRTFDVGMYPKCVVVADFNGDGHPDLAVPNSNSSDVSVLLGNGDGTFRSAVNYNVDVGAQPTFVVAGDFNGDGKPDLAVVSVNSGAGGVSVLLGNGDGTFQAAANYSVGIVWDSVSAAVGDFNGDGKLDLAVANQGSSPNYSDGSVSVLFGKGDGTYQATVNFNPGVRPHFVAVGDFNGDGKADLAVATSDSISVLLGKGDGTFQAATMHSSGGNPQTMAAGDFNRDGKPDLAVVNSGAGGVSVLLGNGDGTFQAPINIGGIGSSSIAVGDFNADGVPDLVAANGAFAYVSVLLGRGDGTFHGAVNSVAVAKPVFIAGGDFNGDGRLDAVAVTDVAYGRVSVILGKGDGALQAGREYSAGVWPNAVTSGDFNGDGKPDLVVASLGPVDPSFGYINGGVSVLLNNGDHTFQTAVNYRAGSAPSSVAVGDFDGDGKPDLAVANLGSGNISILLGKGDGTFLGAANYGTGPNPQSVTVGDFNSDGKPDIAVANHGSNNVSVLLGKGDGTFLTAVSYVTGANPQSVAVGDFNGDGKADLAVANFGPVTGGSYIDGVAVLLGNGDGTFLAAANYVTGTNPQSVAVGDFNGDGKPDLVVANLGSGDVSVLLGKGDGTFRVAVSYPVGPALWSVAVGDFNGDGTPDLAVASSVVDFVSVLLGNGDGTFQDAANYKVGNGPVSVHVTDFDGDGKPDLAVASRNSDSVSVLLNTCGVVEIGLVIVPSTSVIISWPLFSAGFVLESTTNLGLTNWQAVVETPTTNNGPLEVTVPLDQLQRFFRLRRP